MSLVTLQTDFGTRESWVAAMKGVLLRHAPTTALVDITHDIPPFDLRLPGLNWLGLLPYFPPGTIHIAVVDPGVGTDRRILCALIQQQLFLCPDNGLLTPLLEEAGPVNDCFAVTNPRWMAPMPHPTFHGRDIFAPVAAHLAKGEPPTECGPPVTLASLRRLPWTRPVIAPGHITGAVRYVDHFGNLWLNIRRSELADAGIAEAEAICRVNTTEIRGLSARYGTEPGALVLLENSQGWLEIAQAQGDAARVLGVGVDGAIAIGVE